MFWKRRKDCEDGSRRPNAASREAIREWREYERGERDLEDFEPIRSYGRQDPLGLDHVYKIKQTSRFKTELKIMKKRGADLSRLYRAIDILANAGTLPGSYHPHPLKGEWEGSTECHIGPNWLFVYRVDDKQLTLIALRTGTHSDIFDERPITARA